LKIFRIRIGAGGGKKKGKNFILTAFYGFSQNLNCLFKRAKSERMREGEQNER